MTDRQGPGLRPDAQEYLDRVAEEARAKAVKDAHYAAVVEGRSLDSIARDDIEEGRRLRERTSVQYLRALVSYQSAALLVVVAGCMGGVAVIVLSALDDDRPATWSVAVSIGAMLAVTAILTRRLLRGGPSGVTGEAFEAARRLVSPATLDYLVAWDGFERRMRVEAESTSGGEHLRLATIIDIFCRRHDVDPADVHDLLRKRNDIAHRNVRFSSTALANPLLRLADLTDLPLPE